MVSAMATPPPARPGLETFIESFGAAMDTAGMPRMAGRAFAVLLSTEDGAATAAELAGRLKASPAAVSGAVNYLVQVGLVTRNRTLGQRRDHYRVDNAVWFEAIARRDEQIMQLVTAVEQGIAAVGPDSAAGRRLEQTRSFFAFLAAEMPGLFDRWRAEQGPAADAQAGKGS
jgi:DNA-binding transcriptional regulator GbsR (MarR family)